MTGGQRSVATSVWCLVAVVTAVALVVGLVAALPARAQTDGSGYCFTDDPPPVSEPPHAIRFGTTPLLAGSAGVSQQEPVPHDPERDVAAVVELRPGERDLVMRLNRMFWADGEEGVRRYAAIVDRYAAAGFDSELQVRYHPPDGAEGDMGAWEDYVRMAVRILGQRPSLSALSITNEANFGGSPNTSDGSYEGVIEAIVVGTVAARDELDRMGRQDVELGFSFAWRWLPNEDREFWRELGRLATPEFRAAVDYVGLQIYPGLVWPPAIRPGQTAGDEVLEALHLLRSCFMPQAGMGTEVDLWITENGYATNLGRTEGQQLEHLVSTVEAVHEYAGTLNVTDYRWFNLRDNDTDGTDLFSAVGLLRDDYTEKPAYDEFRRLIADFGTEAVRGGRRTDATPDGGGGPPVEVPGPPTAPHDDGVSLPSTGGGAPATAASSLIALIALAAGRRR